MTRKEAIRINQQETILLNLGFTREEAEQLRRISMILHRWHERECGTDHSCLVRGRWNRETASFEYDDNGQPYYEFSGASGKRRYSPTRDRQRGAVKRLRAILDARNERKRGPAAENETAEDVDVRAYVQGDPRGAALYILRPGDVPAGKDVHAYYDRGICVY